MKKHSPAEDMKKELDIIMSKINALEVGASDKHQKETSKVLRKLVEGQIHSIDEFEHLKKAIDLLTLEMFEIKNKIKS